MRDVNKVVIVLGSNIDKERHLPLAVRLLVARCRVTAVSSIYETIPAGLRNQPDFLNAAVLIETTLSAAQIKQTIIDDIETELKRVRVADKNAARTIDADMVLFNDEIFTYDGGDGQLRSIPDPDLLEFAHVAVPVAELLPEMSHPETGETLRSIADRLLTAVTAQYGRPPLWKRPDIVIDR